MKFEASTTPYLQLFTKKERIFITLQNVTTKQLLNSSPDLVLSCKFGELLEPFVKDRFIMCLQEQNFTKLCETDDILTLHDAFKKSCVIEMNMSSNTNSVDNHVNCVNDVSHNKYQRNKKKNGNEMKLKKKHKSCKYRGWNSHDAKNCKSKNGTYHLYRKIDQISSICRSELKAEKL